MSTGEKKRDRRTDVARMAIGAGAVEGASPPRTEGLAPGRPDPEVVERPVRRTFTAEFKRRVVEEAAACTAPGQLGALLRQYGLYSSHVVLWRRQGQAGALAGLAARRRGRRARAANPLAATVVKLEREKARLEQRLQQAETIIEFQKKVSDLLGIPLRRPGSDGTA